MNVSITCIYQTNMIEGNSVSKTVFSIVFDQGHEKYALLQKQKTKKKKHTHTKEQQQKKQTNKNKLKTKKFMSLT